MHSRTLIAALASATLALGMTAAVAQTTAASPSVDGQSAAPMAGADAGAAANTEAKPAQKKHRQHKKSSPPGGTNSAGDAPQSGGNAAATSTGNSQPGASKQSQ